MWILYTSIWFWYIISLIFAFLTLNSDGFDTLMNWIITVIFAWISIILLIIYIWKKHNDPKKTFNEYILYISLIVIYFVIITWVNLISDSYCTEKCSDYLKIIIQNINFLLIHIFIIFILIKSY
jgi:hypothetical protein